MKIVRRIQVLFGVLLLAGCARPPMTDPPGDASGPSPAPATVPVPATAPAPVSPRESPADTCAHSCVNVCVLRAGRLETVRVLYNPTTGDTTTTGGQPFSRAFPTDSTYAEGARWYQTSGPITVLGGLYNKYGLPRDLGPSDVVPVAAFRGVAVFAEEAANPRRPEVIYIPVRPGCWFQAYTPMWKM